MLGLINLAVVSVSIYGMLYEYDCVQDVSYSIDREYSDNAPLRKREICVNDLELRASYTAKPKLKTSP